MKHIFLGASSRSLELIISLHFQLRYVATKVSLAVLLGLSFGILLSQLQPSSSLMNILAFPGTLGRNGHFNYVSTVGWLSLVGSVYKIYKVERGGT